MTPFVTKGCIHPSSDETGSWFGCPVEEQKALLKRVDADIQLRDDDIDRMVNTYPHKDMAKVKLLEISAQHKRLKASFKAYIAWVIQKDSRWICDEVKARCAESDKASFDLHKDAVATYGRGRPLPPSPNGDKDKDKGGKGGSLVSFEVSPSPLLLIGAAGLIYLLATRK